MKHTTIYARDIPDAWFQAVDATLNAGRVNVVDHGSYVGQKRWELDYVTIRISEPWREPFIPEMPPHLSEVPPPTTEEYIYKYLPYLMEARPLAENEQYTYGQRIQPQMEAIIERYKKNGFGSNQECISVARPDDILLDDPPCLRQIDTRIFKGEELLHFFIYFRSWDLWNGLPANLGAIMLMQKFMADAIGVAPGQMICASKGLHLYDHVWDVAKMRTGYDKLDVNMMKCKLCGKPMAIDADDCPHCGTMYD